MDNNAPVLSVVGRRLSCRAATALRKAASTFVDEKRTVESARGRLLGGKSKEEDTAEELRGGKEGGRAAEDDAELLLRSAEVFGCG